MAFWKGMFDAYGDKDKNGDIYFDQKSQIIASQIYLLATNLGYSVSINDNQDIYRISLTEKEEIKNPNAIKKIHEITYEGYVYDFNIAYNDQGLVDQFYSDISILDDNLETISKKTIFVNEPLRSQGSTFYQTDWSVTKLRVTLNDRDISEVLLKEIPASNSSRFWIGSVIINQNKLILVFQDIELIVLR